MTDEWEEVEPCVYQLRAYTESLADVVGGSEREEFEILVAKYEECKAGSGGGCACLGGCLGNHLAKLRRKYDANYIGNSRWWSDQLHGALLTRPGDSGRAGAPLTASNYWTGSI